jgi:hypothetical protein
MNNLFRIATSILLLFLVLLDIVLSLTCLFFPTVWFRVFHHAPYVDPQGLLRRTGAVWAAFTLLQLLALVRWRSRPYWLPLIAGVRLTEIFTIWVCLYAYSFITRFGKASLLISSPANVLFACFLVASYQWLTQLHVQT